MKQKGFVPIFILLGVIAILIASCVYYFGTLKNKSQKPFVVPIEEEIPNPFPYQRPSIPAKHAYITFLVGDSIMAALGRNANQLRLELLTLYPEHEFVNYNYGFGATNILTLPKRLNSQTTYRGETFPPIIEQIFDLIIFDSFAYNPLSEYPLEEGLKKQEETLDKSIKEVIIKHPNSIVAIMTPIAPSLNYFAKGVYELSPELRKQWAQERIAYINNVIEFAQKNNIPLINVYEKSLSADGQVNLKYINKNDYIHPSAAGINLISKTIADFIYQNQIFPE